MSGFTPGPDAALPAPLIISDDVWMSAGLSALLTDAGYPVAQARLPSEVCRHTCTLSDGLIIGYLPRDLGLVMALLCRLAEGLPQPGTRLVLLTAAPVGWVRDTLLNLMPERPVRGELTVLPAGATPSLLLRAVNGYVSDTTEAYGWSGFRALNGEEVAGLVGLLVHRLDIRQQAALRRVPENWQARVLQSAMQKVGAYSVRRLLTWRPDRPYAGALLKKGAI